MPSSEPELAALAVLIGLALLGSLAAVFEMVRRPRGADGRPMRSGWPRRRPTSPRG